MFTHVYATMALELHIWGPAFGLPSIDCECNAAVAYLHHALTPRSIEWILVPSHDTSISPSGNEHTLASVLRNEAC